VGFQDGAAGRGELDPIGLEAVEDRAVLGRHVLAQFYDVPLAEPWWSAAATTGVEKRANAMTEYTA
jgi:hypothetical protein